MPDRPHLATAPARGRYDRAQSRQTRQAEQKARLVGWIGTTYLEHGPALTVQDVVRAAGVGRNTFYEYFDGLEHALDYAAQTHAKALRERIMSELENARTPIAKLRELSRAWFDEVERDPAQTALLLRATAGTGARTAGSRSAAAAVFASVLADLLQQARSHDPASHDLTLIDYVAFAAEGGVRSLLGQGAPRPTLQEGLSTLLTRSFR
ncbi:MAG TPA: TetR/AcrR family transcriptional regulator [Polyangiaceae bacterium]|nr:TetR/AcrR family transcriptional regulator [Polyangiaceae bacterium]